jgi:hypothetical protein
MRRLGEILLVGGIGYLAFASYGPLWFPWDVLSALMCTVAGIHLGEFRPQWKARAPIHDPEHERFVDFHEHGRPKL